MLAMDPPLLRGVAASRRQVMMTRLLLSGGSARRYRGSPTTPGIGLCARRAPNREKEAHHSSEAGNNRAWLHPHSIDQGAPKLKRRELNVRIDPSPKPGLALGGGWRRCRRCRVRQPRAAPVCGYVPRRLSTANAATAQLDDALVQVAGGCGNRPASSSRYSGRVIPSSQAMWPSLSPSRTRSRGRC